MRWFKKKTEQTIVEKPIEEKEERISYLEVARKLGKYSKNKIDSNELFNKLFPRQAATYIATKGGKQVAMDEMHKPVAWNNALPEEMLPFFTEYFIGYQACALLAQNAYIKKICEIPAQDAVAVDYKLHYRNSDADKDEKNR